MYPITADPQVAIRIAHQQTTERIDQARAARRARTLRPGPGHRRPSARTSLRRIPALRFVTGRWATARG